MQKIKSYCETYVETITWKRMLFATVLFFLLTYIIDYSPIGVDGLLQITGGANILDFEKSYPPDKAYLILKNLGEAGRHFYLTLIMPTDIFFPISFMFFNTCWISLFLKHLTNSGNLFRLLPLLAVFNMLCDWGENIGITAMLLNYPKRLSAVCYISSTITTVKFICVLLLVILLLVFTIYSIERWIIGVFSKKALSN